MATGGHQQLIYVETLGFGHAPRRNPLAAHAINKHRFAFQHFHLKPGRRQINGQGASADAAPYDDDIESPHRCVPHREQRSLGHAS